MSLHLNSDQLNALAGLLETADIAPDITEAVSAELRRERERHHGPGRRRVPPTRVKGVNRGDLAD